MAAIKESHLVTKSNILNELRANNMTLQELRFLCIYLSKINPADTKTRVVRFPLADFQAIMELGRININYMTTVTNGLLSKVVNVANDRGGYSGFQLFKECTVSRDEANEWYVEIDAHDKALPFLFELKDRYFSYQLWNALRLKSPNQLRMYETLKQYEKIGMRILPIETLRDYLGIEKNEYPRFDNFKTRVLDACQEALAENTDIKFTYEPHGKKGQGGKILFLKFTIKKNEKYVDQLSLDNFIEQKKDIFRPSDYDERFDERISFLSDACNNEFSPSEMVVLHNAMLNSLTVDIIKNEIASFDYLRSKYDEMRMRSDKGKIKNRFAYLKSIIGTK